MRFKNKSVFITGAARGIGKSFADAFAKEGAKVAIGDINIEQANNTIKEIGNGSIAIELDVTNQKSIENCVNSIINDFGCIDILINNAALFTAAPIKEITREDYNKVFDVNVAGTLFTLQAVAKHMIKRGKGGKIINMASQAGRRGEPLVAVYCATKAAVISITQSAGLNLISHGINVNAISPGVVDGEHWDGVDAFFAKYENKQLGEKKKEVDKNIPFGRIATPKDLIGMALFLASKDADYIVAQTYNVDGGQWMS